MIENYFDISKFQLDQAHFSEVNLVLTVKSFDLQAIRKRYLASKKNVDGKAGSITRRTPAIGGIVSVCIKNGKIVSEKILARLKEPRGIATNNNLIAIACENTADVIDGEKTYKIEHPWFSYIHTLDISPWNSDEILIASSGLDCLFIVNYKTNKIVWEWFAWENGFDKAHNPETNSTISLTRDAEVAKQYIAENIPHKLIDNPESEALPTALRAAFINSVCFDPLDNSTLFATFFHEGKVFKISMETGASESVVHGLKNPHGGRRLNNFIAATSTAAGHLILENENERNIYDFSNLPGKPKSLANREWLQNTIMKDDIMVAIDSNRNAFVLLDTKSKKYCMAPYNQDWAVQDGIFLNPDSDQINQISAL